MDNKKLDRYVGDYDKFMEVYEMKKAQLEAAYNKQPVSYTHLIVNDNAEIFFSNALVYRRIVKNLSNDDINKISGDMKDSLKAVSYTHLSLVCLKVADHNR